MREQLVAGSIGRERRQVREIAHHRQSEAHRAVLKFHRDVTAGHLYSRQNFPRGELQLQSFSATRAVSRAFHLQTKSAFPQKQDLGIPLRDRPERRIVLFF
jgi:hypothetical protein